MERTIFVNERIVRAISLNDEHDAYAWLPPETAAARLTDAFVRLDRPEASEFGVDDRPEVNQASDGEQSALFADTAEDQQTLGSENAAA